MSKEKNNRGSNFIPEAVPRKFAPARNCFAGLRSLRLKNRLGMKVVGQRKMDSKLPAKSIAQRGGISPWGFHRDSGWDFSLGPIVPPIAKNSFFRR